MTQVSAPLSQQAMKVMDQDGETAMWQFIASNTLPDCQPPAHQTPRAVYLSDGCIIHLSQGSYTFIHRNKDDAGSRTTTERASTTDQELVPAFFQPAQPLFWWPSQEHLYEAVLQAAINQELDKSDNRKGQAPQANDLEEFVPEAFEAVQAWTPMANPDSPNLRDELEAYLTDLAQDILTNMDPERLAAVRQKASDLIETSRRQRNPDPQPQTHHVSRESVSAD